MSNTARGVGTFEQSNGKRSDAIFRYAPGGTARVVSQSSKSERGTEMDLLDEEDWRSIFERWEQEEPIVYCDLCGFEACICDRIAAEQNADYEREVY